MRNRILCALAIITIIVIIGLHYCGVAFFEYNGPKEGSFIAEIVSEAKEKEYNYVYTAKIDGKKFLIYIPKKIEISNIKNENTKPNYKKDIEEKNELQYGDKIEIEATYSEPSKARNTGGFDYSLYLKSKKIYGIFKVSNVSNLKKSNKTYVIANVRKYIKQTLRDNLKKDTAELAIGLLLGDKSNLAEGVQEDFKGANLTHMLAISGAHFSYIILIVNWLGKKFKFKRLEQIITIISIIFFMNLTGNTPSVARAGIISIMSILASILKRRNDFWNSLSLSFLIQIIYNPYVIFDIGLMLSYSGAIGIVTFYKFFSRKIKLKIVSVTISANVIILPIMIWKFNTISFTFIISNVLASGLLGVIIILEFISIIIKVKPIFIILELSLTLLMKIASICSQIPFSKVYVTTGVVYAVIVIYLIIFAIFKAKKKIVPILLSLALIFNLTINTFVKNTKEELVINFIDVGQGDSTLIKYKGKTIMIDTGGSTDSSYDVGKSVLHRYLLNQGIMHLDYMMLSHFDADHCQGGVFILKNIKVKNLIICRQAKDSKLYREIIKLAKQMKTNIIYVQGGDSFKVQNLKCDILHPSNELIGDNPLNNNAIVCKFTYYHTKILFTGDIEKIAESQILKEYEDLNILQSTILKVGHHGSKTSTTQDFLDCVNPPIALIGVGENNKFNHPNDEVIERLKNKNTKIYRTDKNGEITIKVNKDGKIRIKTKFNTS